MKTTHTWQKNIFAQNHSPWKSSQKSPCSAWNFLHWGMASIANCSTPTSSGSSLPTTLTSFHSAISPHQPQADKKNCWGWKWFMFWLYKICVCWYWWRFGWCCLYVESKNGVWLMNFYHYLLSLPIVAAKTMRCCWRTGSCHVRFLRSRDAEVGFIIIFWPVN